MDPTAATMFVTLGQEMPLGGLHERAMPLADPPHHVPVAKGFFEPARGRGEIAKDFWLAELASHPGPVKST